MVEAVVETASVGSLLVMVMVVVTFERIVPVLVFCSAACSTFPISYETVQGTEAERA